MKHKKTLKSLLLIAILSVSVGAVLNCIVRSLNRGMPAIGYTVALGKYVPINQGTKLVFLADIMRLGNYVLSVGDLFFFTGIFICLIALWIAVPQGRKFFPLLIVSIIGIFMSVAQANMRSTELLETAAVLSTLVIYWSYRSSIRKKAVIKTQPVKSMSNAEPQDVGSSEMGCVCREGVKQCTWWFTRDFNGQLKSYCANPNIPIQAKIICDGNQPQFISKWETGTVKVEIKEDQAKLK
jgi:uncharacterized membrane protein YiaA